jgi:tripartite-type tricarboxylate transporter receptor subunit TctC
MRRNLSPPWQSGYCGRVSTLPQHHRRQLLAAGIGLAGTGTGSAQAIAQDSAIRLLVGAAAGTGIDIAARTYAAPFSAALGQPVMVINRPSAGGVLAAEAVAQAAPDGCTLLYASMGTLAIAPQMIRPLPYHPVTSFTHLARLACGGFAIAVPATSPAQDMAGLVALLRGKGAAANYASSQGSVAYHLAGAMLLTAAGASATHIGYRTTGEVIAAAASGALDFIVDLRTLLQPHHGAGGLRLLAVTSAHPDPGMPELPPLHRLYPGLVLESWVGFSAPRGLPAADAARLEAAAHATLADPAVGAMLLRSGATADWLPGPAFSVFVGAEMQRLAGLAAAAGLAGS